MEPTTLRRRLSGVIAFSPTPFDAAGGLDVETLVLHVAFLVDQGVDAVAVCGGVGEFYALDEDEYRATVEAAASAVAGRVPLLAGVGHSTDIAVRLATTAVAAGASGLLVNPFYFVDPEPAGAVEHYRRLGERSGLGLVVFSTGSTVYRPADLERLAEVDQVVAVKDEHGDVDLFADGVRRLGDRFVWINGMAEPLAVAYAQRGASGMTSGLVNLDPGLTRDIWDAARRGDEAGHRRLLDSRAEGVLALRRRRPGYHITVLKEAMHILGRSSATVRLPLVPIREDERRWLRDYLAAAGYPVTAPTR